jgi:hypothetical protein
VSNPRLEAALATGPVGDELYEILQPEESLHEPKVFIVRAWQPVDATGEPPGSVCWLMASTSLGEAERRAKPLRTILHYVLNAPEETDEVLAVEDAVLSRIHYLPPQEAMRVFQDVGVPTFFHAGFQDADEIAVIPFTVLTGFSVATVADLAPQAPRPATIPPDPFKTRRF